MKKSYWQPDGAATVIEPNGEISNAIAANSDTSKKIDAAMGSPSLNKRKMAESCGLYQWANNPIEFNRLFSLMYISIEKNISQYTMAVATPQPTPPMLGHRTYHKQRSS